MGTDIVVDDEEEDPEEDAPVLPRSMYFWFLPAAEIMQMPPNVPLPRHQVWRDRGSLVKRRMTMEDVSSGRFVHDTVAVSHRWPTQEHFDPEASKVRKLQEILRGAPSIQYLWIDWVCAPQWHGAEEGSRAGRTDEEEAEFRTILENILPYIFLGCRVIALYERSYNQRFWPNVECWVATKMVTKKGLVPADKNRQRLEVHGILSQEGLDKECQHHVLDMWHNVGVNRAIRMLAADDILVTNKKDKDVNLKVLAALNGQLKRIHTESRRSRRSPAPVTLGNV
jgi:hypothetical protein